MEEGYVISKSKKGVLIILTLKKSKLAIVIALLSIAIVVVGINIKEKEKQYREEIEQSHEELNTLNQQIKQKQKRNKDLIGQVDSIKEDHKNTSEELERVRVELKKEKEKAPNRGSTSRNQTSPANGRLLGTFEATAYDDSVESQGQWVGQTATGVKPQVGVIAVDPKVIPLGTKLYVEGYNGGQVVTAADTGGAIKGNRIDVFLNTREECRAWGRKKVKVWLAE